MIDVADPGTDERLYRELAPELVRFASALVGWADAADVMLPPAATEAMTVPNAPPTRNRRRV